jgi:hypothetical protein
MSQQRLGAANEAKQAATDSLVSGVGGFVGGVGAAKASGAAQNGEDSNFMADVMTGMGM